MYTGAVELVYPGLRFDAQRDDFVVWVRWVSLEAPPSPTDPPNQGIRVELLLNRNSVLGPTIVFRRDLDPPVYLRANRQRTVDVLRAATRMEPAGAKPRGASFVDIQLVIHGSIAHAPYAALYHVRDYDGQPIDTAPLQGTPLLQVQPSTPADRWHVAGQANLRVQLSLATPSRRLAVVR